ncbi:TPA: hypothetical protein I9146_002668 [Clostridium perfringens]|nr:hypothetical protein [Clostridium perfringens]HAT4349925.1 hypothetical protein [Clostridium perfringens]
MRLWKFENTTEAVKENMRNEKMLSQLEVNLYLFKDNHKALARIMEKAHGLIVGEITEAEGQILSLNLKDSDSVKAYVKQFSKFGHLGFNPNLILGV